MQGAGELADQRGRVGLPLREGRTSSPRQALEGCSEHSGFGAASFDPMERGGQPPAPDLFAPPLERDRSAPPKLLGVLREALHPEERMAEAAADGVGARSSATKSATVTTGIGQAWMAQVTPSSLNAQRSSREPPPRTAARIAAASSSAPT